LFNLVEEHTVFEKEGLKAYLQLQCRKKDEIIQPGTAFPFLKVKLRIA
jgi:hypothetical protein